GEQAGHSSVHIDFVPSLDDWKTAWDFIHFQGFLGVKMSLQFTWQGCDSILAAPLVIDMVRLLAHAKANQQAGSQPHLAQYFKSPYGVDHPDFPTQFKLLTDYLAEQRSAK
ncbi:MAG: myo-inositol-1-phosphate synthase, partial [Planctomycetota bacterium]